MKIAMTGFALRQWDAAAGRKRIAGITPDNLVELCNSTMAQGAVLADGYAPFCKHLFIDNTTPTLCAFAPITEKNHALLKSGHLARRQGELAVLERWFEGLEPPRARYLDVIVYSRAQLELEAANGPDDDPVPDCDWGIVSIIAVLEPVEPPMPPITQMRNALGRQEGGSGVPIDKDAYARAVAFWEKHAAVR